VADNLLLGGRMGRFLIVCPPENLAGKLLHSTFS
jgi:hypothetical protein